MGVEKKKHQKLWLFHAKRSFFEARIIWPVICMLCFGMFEKYIYVDNLAVQVKQVGNFS